MTVQSVDCSITSMLESVIDLINCSISKNTTRNIVAVIADSAKETNLPVYSYDSMVEFVKLSVEPLVELVFKVSWNEKISLMEYIINNCNIK